MGFTQAAESKLREKNENLPCLVIGLKIIIALIRHLTMSPAMSDICCHETLETNPEDAIVPQKGSVWRGTWRQVTDKADVSGFYRNRRETWADALCTQVKSESSWERRGSSETGTRWTVSGTGKRFSCVMDSFGNLVRFMVHFSVVWMPKNKMHRMINFASHRLLGNK